MKIFALILSVVISPGCVHQSNIVGSASSSIPQPSQDDLIGTWRWDSFTRESTGRNVATSTTFFVRFYADGSIVSWPMPTGSRELSRGKYKVMNGKLYLPDALDPTPSTLIFSGDKMWFANAIGDVTYYYRVQPNLEPGTVE